MVPAHSSQGTSTPPMEAMLTMGNGPMRTSPSRSEGAAATTLPMLSQWLWLRGTPFGRDSVPDVQQMVKTSSALGR